MKKLTKRDVIVIIISILLGICIVALIGINTKAIRIAFTEPKITQESYDDLKQYALDVATGTELDKIDGIKSEKTIQDDCLKVKIQTDKLYGVEAIYPIKFDDKLDLENGIIEITGTILYDDVQFSQYTEVMSKTNYIILGIFIIFFSGFVGWLCFVWAPKEFRRVNKMKKTENWP